MEEEKVDLNMSFKRPVGVEYGQLSNGLRFYVRSNPERAHTLQVSLIVRTGSVFEEEDERGVAHTIEHLAFTATDGYKNADAMKYLDTIKAMGGPCQHAKTYLDFTTYGFTVNNQQDLCHAIAILAEMSCDVKVSNQNLDKEREVLLGEYDAEFDDEFEGDELCRAFRYKGSKYARSKREEAEGIKTLSVETVEKFYRKWYHLASMCVTIVGDLTDTQSMVDLVKTYFGPKHSEFEPPTIPDFIIPAHCEPRFLCLVDPTVDPEVSQVIVNYQRGRVFLKTLKDLYQIWTESIFLQALEKRFAKITSDDVDVYRIASVLPERCFTITANCNAGGTIDMLACILTELARIRLHGFDDDEVAVACDSLLRSLESSYLRSDSKFLEPVKHFLLDDPVIDSIYEAQLQRNLIPKISSAEVLSIAANFRTSCNCSIIMLEPRTFATDGDLADVVQNINFLEKEQSISPYSPQIKEQNQAEFDFGTIVPGTIMEQSDCPKIGATELLLSNGMRVCYKATEFVDDRVYLHGFSYGGLSELPENDYLSCSMACAIAGKFPIGGYEVHVKDSDEEEFTVLIDFYMRSFRLAFHSSHIEAALKRVHLLFTTYWEASEELLKRVMENMASKQHYNDQDPERSFSDYVKELNGGKSYFFKSVKAEDLSKVDPLKACQYFSNCFTDPSNFVVILVGNIDPIIASNQFLFYLGGIPKPLEPILDLPREKLRAVPFDYPATKVRKEIWKPQEGARCSLSFPVKLKNEKMDEENCVYLFLMQLVRGRVMKTVLSMERCVVYHVGVVQSEPCGDYSSMGNTYSTISLDFRCHQAKAWELIDVLLDEMERLQNEGPSDNEILVIFKALDSVESSLSWLCSILAAYKSRHYQGHLDDAYEVQENILNLFAESISNEVVKSALREMLPFPCKGRYTAVVLSNETRLE